MPVPPPRARVHLPPCIAMLEERRNSLVNLSLFFNGSRHNFVFTVLLSAILQFYYATISIFETTNNH